MTPPVQLLAGDCRARLAELEPESIHCAITSPPYYGLRAYGTDPLVWGGDPDCPHDWSTERYYREGGSSRSSADAFHESGPANAARLKETRWRETTECQCGAWRGELGLEPTPALYVEHLVEVFRAVHRVLRKDGTLWLNLGDCYATGAGKVGECPGGGEQGERWKGYRGTRGESPKHATGAMGPMTQPNRLPLPGLKPKDLIGIPWRVALALQADGWYLRSDIVWEKPSAMPESVRDRPTRSHEYVFLLAKAERYYYDQDAIREPQGVHNGKANTFRRENSKRGVAHVGQTVGTHRPDRPDTVPNADGRNRRTVWTISTEGYEGAHFATFPPALVTPCLLAGCPVGGTVLDPFGGTGTVAEVAIKHERRAILIELSPEYCRLAEKRLAAVHPVLPLFATGRESEMDNPEP